MVAGITKKGRPLNPSNICVGRIIKNNDMKQRGLINKYNYNLRDGSIAFRRDQMVSLVLIVLIGFLVQIRRGSRHQRI